jgi:hypothetical protein
MSVRWRGSRDAGGRVEGSSETDASRVEVKESKRGRGEREGGKGRKREERGGSGSLVGGILSSWERERVGGR